MKVQYFKIFSFFFLLSLIFSCEIAPQETKQTLRLGIIDTGFCVAEIKTPQNIKIKDSFDATESLRENPCYLEKDHPQLHGQKVLEVFVENFDKKISLEIYPLTVFDSFGQQKLVYWENAHKRANELKLDVILTASGFPHQQKYEKYPEWNILTFAPTGRISGSIKADTNLFPQVLAPQSNIVIIGSYKTSIDDENIVLRDEASLYKNVTDYYQADSSDSSSIRGSSYSVAVAAAKALSICSVENMRECLRGRTKLLRSDIEDDPIPSF